MAVALPAASAMADHLLGHPTLDPARTAPVSTKQVSDYASGIRASSTSNLVAAIASLPADHLSDKVGRRGVPMLPLIIFAAVYAGFALTTSFFAVSLLFVFYGFHAGAFRAVGKALAADLVPPELRASGIGWYATTVGVTGLAASVAGGQLWTRA